MTFGGGEMTGGEMTMGRNDRIPMEFYYYSPSETFVVGSLLCSERFFSGCSGFPLSSKTNIYKFQFDLEALYHEPLARVIAQALPMFDIKFDFLI